MPSAMPVEQARALHCRNLTYNSATKANRTSSWKITAQGDGDRNGALTRGRAPPESSRTFEAYPSLGQGPGCQVRSTPHQ